MSRRGLAVAGALCLAGSFACTTRPDELPRLIVLIAVDQLRADRLDPELPGGLGRLAREGRVFPDAALAHAHTETCPGHVTMSTGRHPGPAGVPSNRWLDPETLRRVYCVEDPAPDARLLRGTGGRSPRSLRVDTLGDWMKSRWPETRVFAVSAKDRAAIALGGRRADAAYWFDRSEAAGFTTSAYYRDALPAWAAAWDAARVLGSLPSEWSHPSQVRSGGARPDDFPGEVDAHSRVSPHPLVDRDDARGSFERIYRSPFIDDLTLDFAQELVEREDLGRAPHPQLLAVSLSATDTVGHLYGPESVEAGEALRQLDARLDRFLRVLEARTAGHLLVVLTSDHGVLPLPEWLLAEQRSQCSLPGGRGRYETTLAAANAAIDRALGTESAADAPWLVGAKLLWLNRARVADAGLSVEAVLEIARLELAAQPGVARVWTRSERASGGGPEPFATLYANSYAADRSADLVLQVEEGCLLSSYDAGTSHGSPYAYDRRVPLVFWGRGVAAGSVSGPAATVDIAPTLAAELGLAVPADLDGRVLSLAAAGLSKPSE
ncbi:MAG: alkaline phosphatase family protein [Proteobacteria bacterium]|nr:alkaline phosphatase family protein [Pseudomonadota bacterium]